MTPPHHDSSSLRGHGRHVVAILVVVLAAFATSFAGAFVFDDHSAILGNPSIRELSFHIFQPPGGGSTVEGRPLFNATLAVNFALSGTNPWSYHALNVLIHAGAALAAFGLIRVLLAKIGCRHSEEVSLLAAIIWAVHPLQTESVTYLSQRTESLMGLFFLATAYFFARGASADTAGNRRWLGASVLTCAIGMACKEVMFSAPLLVLLIDRTCFAGTFRQALTIRRGYYVALFSMWAVLFALLIGHTTRGGTIGRGAGVTHWEYALCQSRALLHYLRLAWFPSPLIFDYGSDFVSLRQVWAYGVIDVALLLLTLWAVLRRSVWGLVGSWYFLILAPTSSFVGGTRQMVAEHRMYLPLLAAVAAFAVLVHALIGRRQARWTCVLIAVGLAAASARRSLAYRTELALFTDTYAKRPDNAATNFDLAGVYESLGDSRAAITHYEAALRYKPESAGVHYNLANLLSKIPTRESDAIRHYELALQLKPNSADAHNNIGSLLGRKPGAEHEALAHYEAAVRLNPEEARFHNNLAGMLARTGNVSRAISEYETALRLKPNWAEVHYNLGNLLAGMPARQADALAHYDAALALRPSWPEAQNNAAIVLSRLQGREEDAVQHYRAAIAANPGYLDARNNLAALLARMPGRSEEALAEYQAILQLQPNSPEAHNNAAVLLARMPGHERDAIAEFETALRLNPRYADVHYNLALMLEELPGRVEDARQHLSAAVRERPDFDAARRELQRLDGLPHNEAPR